MSCDVAREIMSWGGGITDKVTQLRAASALIRHLISDVLYKPVHGFCSNSNKDETCGVLIKICFGCTACLPSWAGIRNFFEEDFILLFQYFSQLCRAS